MTIGDSQLDSEIARLFQMWVLEDRGFKVILAIIHEVRERVTPARKQHRSKSKVAAVQGITDLSTT